MVGLAPPRWGRSDEDTRGMALPSAAAGGCALPAGGHATSISHLARSVCRRAERRVVTLSKEETINPYCISYLNRLSDLLFVIARVLARHENGKEVLWQPYQDK